MSTHKWFDKICCVVFAFVIAITVIFMNAESLGIQKSETVMGYENRLFSTDKVHEIDIVMDDWDGFLETCTDEEYTDCTVVIDGESYKNVAIRAKGNTSLSQVKSYENNRYSFKIEFDHYDSVNSYYGLDKLCLNNIIQDYTYMKDYLTYRLMNQFGLASPLCSYANITVNGDVWGLYLAVEGIEESFLKRNYGNDYGELYKPDSMSMGGGRGNGKDFEMDFSDDSENEEKTNNSPENESTENESDSNENSEQTDTASSDNGGQSLRGNMGGRANNSFGNIDYEKVQSILEEAGLLKDGELTDDATIEKIQEILNENDMSETADMLSNITLDQLKNMISSPGNGNAFEKMGGSNGGGFGGGSRGSDDVCLIYSDDDYDSYSNIFDNAKTDVTDSDKARLIAALKNINENTDIESSVDVEQVIRYFVVHNYVLNFDSYTGSMIHNYYLYEKSGKLTMLPWDYNLAFGGFQSGSEAESLVNYPIDSPVSGGTVDSRPMLAWILNNEEYTELYHELFSEFISEIFDSGKFTEMIDSVKEMISPYVEQDPTKFCTYEQFETGIDTLKEFCLLRAESISGQLDGTIGSTSEAQTDKTGFISAEGISISDMGSQGMGQENGFNKIRSSSNQQSTNDTDEETDTKSADSEASDSAERKVQGEAAANQSDMSRQPPELPDGADGNADFGQAGGTPPDMQNADNQNANPGQGEAATAQADDSTQKNTQTESTTAQTEVSQQTESQTSGADGGFGQAEGNQVNNNSDRDNKQSDGSPSGDKAPEQSSSAENWILSGVSFAVLIAGIVFASLFKRRR